MHAKGPAQINVQMPFPAVPSVHIDEGFIWFGLRFYRYSNNSKDSYSKNHHKNN